MTDESGFRIGETAFKIVKVFLNSILKDISLTGDIYRAVLAKLLLYTFLPVNEKTCISIFKNTLETYVCWNDDQRNEPISGKCPRNQDCHQF